MLESRFPEVIAKLSDNVQEGMVDGLKPIARVMGATAPDTDHDEEREFSAESVRADQARAKALSAEIGKADVAAAVFSEDWYWFLAEYGTVKEPARPFMRPAVEGGREGISKAIMEKLREL